MTTMSAYLSLNVAMVIRETEMVGPGLRDGIWVQGCSIRCPGCANQDFLPHVERRRIPVAALVRYCQRRRPQIDGISVLGGEPTEQPLAMAALLERAQACGLSTVVFSGHLYETLKLRTECADILAHTDLLIDGPYVESKRDPTLHWRGSTNQRLIRLTDRFSPSDLESPRATGEILVSPRGIVLHGVGTRDCGLAWPQLEFKPRG